MKHRMRRMAAKTEVGDPSLALLNRFTASHGVGVGHSQATAFLLQVTSHAVTRRDPFGWGRWIFPLAQQDEEPLRSFSAHSCSQQRQTTSCYRQRSRAHLAGEPQRRLSRGCGRTFGSRTACQGPEAGSLSPGGLGRTQQVEADRGYRAEGAVPGAPGKLRHCGLPTPRAL